ncbi:hypothetical protein [Roseiflexus sp.]|uniref:hypothetical protein n=1 Tax=Roseiflexus sp. TaxID=2562120 RepID=UPI00398ADB77
MIDRALVVRSMLVLTVCALMCIAATGALLALQPPPIRTYDDQVAYGLRTQRIAYRQIRFGDMYPDRVNRQYGDYVGPVTIAVYVTLDDGRDVAGWVECRRIAENCTLSLLDLEMRRIPLPEFSRQRAWPWLEWLERTMTDLWN